MNYFSALHKCLLLVLFMCLPLAAVPGCGYHFQAAGEPVGIGISSLAIPLVASTSSTLGFEGDFTRIIREEFISHARVPLVSTDDAAMVLVGEVTEIETDPLSYELYQVEINGRDTTYEETRSRRLKIKLDAKLIERATGKVIWEDKGMEEKATYSVGTDPLNNRYNQRTALQEIARRFASRLYLKTMERF